MSRTRIAGLAARIEPLFDLVPLILLLVLLPWIGGLWSAIAAGVVWCCVAVIYKAMSLRSHRHLFRRVNLLLIFAAAAASCFLSTGNCSRVERWISIIAAICLVLEAARISWAYHRLRREMWLPLVSVDGNTVGQIARSVADAGEGLPSGLLLPVVRVLALCGDMVYLQQHPVNESGSCQTANTMRCGCISLPSDEQQRHCIGSGYDTPFAGYVRRAEQVEDAARRLVYRRFCGIVRPELQFLLRYTPRGGDRLVYLYLIQVETPDLLLHHRCPIEGKWWPTNQIAQAAESDFCGYIREELPYINQTVRLAEKLRRKATSPKAQAPSN